MSLCQRTFSRSFVCLLTLTALSAAGFAQTPTFTRHSFAYDKFQEIRAHGDFNNDGREDFIMLTVDDSVQPAVFAHQIYLSNGDGNYNSPIPLEAPPNSVIAVGDFNHDGKLDYATSGVSATSGFNSEMHIYLGNGNGSFQAPHVIAGENASTDGFTAADMNHDGKTD